MDISHLEQFNIGKSNKNKGILWDLSRPLEGSCAVEVLKFSDEEAQHVFWHSSAHVLGQCLEKLFSARLTVGPALSRGFYYDAYVGESLKYSPENYKEVEKMAAKIIQENQKYERVEITKEEALDLFSENPFKVQLIKSKVPEGSITSCYRIGEFVDLCRGPHLNATGMIKAFKVESHSSCYWLGKADNASLQRMYAISFPTKKMLEKDAELIAESKKRDHREVGNKLSLFFFDSILSPGSAFWLPAGARFYNKLCDFMRSEYRIRGFQEVISPNIYSHDLYKTSGHADNYKNNMFNFDVEGKQWALKPMNCPGHCVMFKHMNLSYRQLPLRLADFGVLHRNEVSGSLTGLTRVRRFQQDDAHIFCEMSQVKSEIMGCLDFLRFTYGEFGFHFQFMLGTRPKKAMGDPVLWQKAEIALATALEEMQIPWKLNHGDGAFYGPKIDIQLQDALQRWHQCGTIQLDFQLPLRFNLQYKSIDTKVKIEEDIRQGFDRPVMIHRAILGSVERMSAVLLEHTGGCLPFWLNPRQIIVCPISEKHNDYGKKVHTILHSKGYEVSLNDSDATTNRKIRDAEVEQWNFILVLGAREEEAETVTVRKRHAPDDQETISLVEFIRNLESLAMPRSDVTSLELKK
eukprot:GHVP01004559.1.p1 GENE.GHVP01004559.1~~GHVP01004559.1.p1  ORF type:complete len:633 (+),score=89.86 GHVP01004559.1:650-2548(+)